MLVYEPRRYKYELGDYLSSDEATVRLPYMVVEMFLNPSDVAGGQKMA